VSLSCIDIDTREIGNTEHILSGVYMYILDIYVDKKIFIRKKRPVHMSVVY